MCLMNAVRLARCTRWGSGVQSGRLSERSFAALRMTLSTAPRPHCPTAPPSSRCRRLALGALRVEPGLVILAILDRERRLRPPARAEGVHHDRQLFRVLGADARFSSARMRPVRNAVGV